MTEVVLSQWGGKQTKKTRVGLRKKGYESDVKGEKVEKVCEGV